MTPLCRVVSSGLALALAVSAGCGTPSASVVDAPREADAGRPNIVWIVSDGLRAPFSGHVATVAEAGVSLTHLAIDTAVPRSVRSALLTGGRRS